MTLFQIFLIKTYLNYGPKNLFFWAGPLFSFLIHKTETMNAPIFI